MRVIFAFLCLLACALNAESISDSSERAKINAESNIYGLEQIEAIKGWGVDSSASGISLDNTLDWTPASANALTQGNVIDGMRGKSGFGELFTNLQGNYFKNIFLALIILVPLAFFGHFMLIGQRRFNHHQKLQVFSRFNIIVHWGAAVPFVLICLTGLIMVFGAHLGGGAFVRFARDVHGFFTPIFAVFGIIMFCMWLKDALFRVYDIKWFMIMGGYLSRENVRIPAGKFNAGQKMWFWIATLGGAIMVISGAIMFFQSTDINTLRLVAIIHNVGGFLIISMLIVHIYMSLFAIEGAIEAIINGKMGEEELSILHSIYYDEIKNNGKLDSMRVY